MLKVPEGYKKIFEDLINEEIIKSEYCINFYHTLKSRNNEISEAEEYINFLNDLKEKVI